MNRYGVGAVTVALVCAAVEVRAQQTNNHVLRAVPTQGQVTLDGKLGDWDLSGEILISYDMENLLDTHSVRAAAMYARDGLYLSFRFRDRTPMVNHVDPKQEPGNGWRSDCVQLRIWADHGKPLGPPTGGRIIHVDCYWYTDGNRPGSIVQFHNMALGKDGFEGRIDHAIGKGVDAAFRKDVDGRGYTQEMRLDWKILRRDGRPYTAGQTLRMGIECMWGDATGKRWPEHRFADLINAKLPQREFFWTAYKAWGEVAFEKRGKLEPSPSMVLLDQAERLRRLRYTTAGPVPIRYETPADGFVTWVVERPDGTRVRNLISNYPRKGGKQTDCWDGTDDKGRLVEPGRYRVRGLYHGPLDVRYEFSYGNPGTPPWETSDGKGNWLSDHANPMDVLADKDRIYAAAPMSENGNTVIAMDYDGNRLWGLSHTGGGFMARVGKYLYMIADHGCHIGGWRGKVDESYRIELIRVDAATGKLASFPDGKSHHEIARWCPLKEGFTRDHEGVTVANKAHNADWCNIQAQGLTAIGATLYASMHFADKLLVIDSAEGKVTGEIPILKPAGLASHGNRLLAISDTRVVEVDPKTQAIRPVIRNGLRAPIGLAVDKAGRIYVSDWVDQMCVKVFSAAGKPMGTIGKKGGRPWVGTYDPQGMLLPRGIAIDARGRLWVAEDDFMPRRVSCWNPDGKLAIEKLGTTWYSGGGCFVFPDRPDRGIVMGNLVELDWKADKWRVLSTLWRSTHPDALLGLNYNSDIDTVVRHKGRTFLVHSANHGVIVVSELTGDVARPVAAVGSCYYALPNLYNSTKGGERPAAIFADRLWVDWRISRMAKAVIPWYFDSPRAGNYRDVNRWMPQIVAGLSPHLHANANFLWNDLDGNGRIERKEFAIHATPHLKPPAAAWGPGTYSRGRADKDLTLVLSAIHDRQTVIWKLPVARWSASGRPVYEWRRARTVVQERPTQADHVLWVGRNGNMLSNQIPLTMFKPNGRRAWTFPNPWPSVHGSHKAPKARHGRLIGPLRSIGSADLGNGVGEVFVLSGNLGQAFVFTADGLYVADVFRDCRSAPQVMPDKPTRGMSIIETSCGGEWFGGQFFKNATDGKLYLVNGHSNINRVDGLETVRRLPTQTVELTRQGYEEAARLLAKHAAEEAKAKSIAILAPRRRVDGVPDADRFDWRREAVARWRFDSAHAAEATWTYDAENLYVCFRDVLDSSPMVNNGKDPTILFKTGDAAVLELRTKANDNTAGVIAGDVRLLFSVFEGKPVAVLYRYRVPGTAKPVPFASPVTTTKIDVVKRLTCAKIAIDRQAHGYTLRASVPLAELGLKPEKGAVYRGDFGIVYSDRAGRVNELRMYWSNPVTGMVNDLAIEAAIQPAMWGRFEVTAK